LDTEFLMKLMACRLSVGQLSASRPGGLLYYL
jgi:hypothetical protein